MKAGRQCIATGDRALEVLVIGQLIRKHQIPQLLISRPVFSDSATPWTAARQASLSFTTSRSFLKLKSIELMMPSNHLMLYQHLLLVPSIFPSIRIFSNKSVLRIRWPKYWSFSFSVSPSNEYSELFPLGLSGLISLKSKGLSRVFSSTTIRCFVSISKE